jgi:isoleucyl-tRNA synthetase
MGDYNAISTATLKFSYNWNNKLDCHAFTTIRLRNDLKYSFGKIFDIAFQDKPNGSAVVLEVKHFYLHQLTEFMARVDTGYSKEQCDNVIRTMYPKVDFTNQQLSFILLVRTPNVL